MKSGDLVEGKMWNFDERHSRPFVEGVEESGLDNPPSTKTFRGVLSINHVDVLDYVQYWCELPSGWAIPLEPDTITVITAE